MKYFKFTILLLFICCMITSCAATHGISVSETTVDPSLDLPVTGENDDAGLNDSPLDGEGMKFTNNSCSTIEEYEKMVRSVKLPERFISYEDISTFGKLQHFVYYEEDAFYSYGLDNNLIVQVSGKHAYGLDKLTFVEGDNEDLRFFPCEGWAYQKIGDAVYMYYNGTLRSVFLMDGLNEIWIQRLNIYEYKPTDTTLGKLLNRSTAEATAKALCEAFRDTSK